jgi:hypothetical protein
MNLYFGLLIGVKGWNLVEITSARWSLTEEVEPQM